MMIKGRDDDKEEGRGGGEEGTGITYEWENAGTKK